MKRIKAWAIVLLSAFVVTGLLSGCSVNIGSKIIDKNAGEYTSGNAEITDKIDSIDIDWSKGSVSVVKGTGKNISIVEECNEELDDAHKLQWWVDGTTLRIKFDNSLGLVVVDIYPEKHLTVTIPEDIELDDFTVSCGSADINIEDIKTDSAEIDTASGRMDIQKLSATDAEFETASGDIILGTINVGKNINIESASGSINADELLASGVKINTASGKIGANKLTADIADIESSSGNTDIVFADCSSANMESSSGSISAEYTNVPDNINVETSSGEINLTLPKDAGFTAIIDTASGDLHCDFPAQFEYSKNELTVGDGKAKINIESSSGDINIYEK